MFPNLNQPRVSTVLVHNDKTPSMPMGVFTFLRIAAPVLYHTLLYDVSRTAATTKPSIVSTEKEVSITSNEDPETKSRRVFGVITNAFSSVRSLFGVKMKSTPSRSRGDDLENILDQHVITRRSNRHRRQNSSVTAADAASYLAPSLSTANASPCPPEKVNLSLPGKDHLRIRTSPMFAKVPKGKKTVVIPTSPPPPSSPGFRDTTPPRVNPSTLPHRLRRVASSPHEATSSCPSTTGPAHQAATTPAPIPSPVRPEKSLHILAHNHARTKRILSAKPGVHDSRLAAVLDALDAVCR